MTETYRLAYRKIPIPWCLVILGALTANFASGATKCVGADGRISYTDGSCPGGAKPIPSRANAADTGPKSAVEELTCAATWLRDRNEFENEIGLVSKSDQVIVNGEKVDMVAAYKRPANTTFNYRLCGKYGYVQANGLRDFSVNMWTATVAVCRAMDPRQSDLVRQAAPNWKISAEERAHCASFSGQFANPSALELDLRAKNHPIP